MKHLFIIVIFFIISFSVNAQTKSICPGESIPTGWVVTDYTSRTDGCTDGLGHKYLVEQRIITRVDNLPKGTTLTICPQPTPSGWVVIRYDTCGACCGANGYLVTRHIIYKQ